MLKRLISNQQTGRLNPSTRSNSSEAQKLRMPGIAGIIGAGSHRENRSTLDAMVKCMMHEPFYTIGTYVNEGLGLWAGSVSHAGSFSDCSPVWNEEKSVCLMFSGETFADQREIESLKVKGHSFTSGNASDLVHLHEEIGIQFLERLNGWFSGVLVDLRKDEVVLFNDRYGLGRIYYCETPEGLFFSSEAKSLLRVLPGVRQLDLPSLAELVSCGCVLQNRSLFSGISLLPGASKWTFRRGQLARKDVYFAKEAWENQAPLDEETYYQHLKQTFARILPKYLSGGSKLAMSLTGGLDGRMIMTAAGMAEGTLPCYTFGGMYRDCADVVLARQVAKICRQSHQVIPVNGKFLAQFPELAEKAIYVSDGTMDVTGSVELYVNRIARQIAPVRLTGNYGSEILRSNVAFQPRPWDDELLTPEFASFVQAAERAYANEVRGHKLSFIAFKQVPWHHYARLSVEQTQLTLRSPYLDNDLVALCYRAPLEATANSKPVLRLIAEGNPALGRIGTDRGLVHRPVPVITNAQRLYRALTIKAENAYDGGMPQWLARVDHVFSPLHLERLFIGRNRFYHFRPWYRDELAPCIKDVLLDNRTRQRPYLRGACLEEMVNSHTQGRRNYTFEIQKILTIELIQRQLIERNWN